MKAIVHRTDLDNNVYLKWNAFVRLLATATPEQLDDNQRPAYLAFCYDAEVQNGGHQQYFENRPHHLVDETIRALDCIGASGQASILRRAAERWRTKARQRPRTVEEYVADSRKIEFNDLDETYYGASPGVIEVLERLLDQQTDNFVEIIGWRSRYAVFNPARFQRIANPASKHPGLDSKHNRSGHPGPTQCRTSVCTRVNPWPISYDGTKSSGHR